jgi:hypothetical protein
MRKLRNIFDGRAVTALLFLFNLGFLANCGGGGGAPESESRTNNVPYAQISFGSGSSWQGIKPLIIDDTGDSGDDGVDIGKVYMAHDDQYLFLRVEVAGIVNNTHEGDMSVDMTFNDAQDARSLNISAKVFLGEVWISQYASSNSVACGGSTVLMCYPAQNYLAVEDHAVEFRVRLDSLDWDLDRTTLSVKASKKGHSDNTADVSIDMDNTYLDHVITVWPDSYVVTEFTIPYASITIDGDISDWVGISPVFIDAFDDVQGVPTANIDQVYISQDNDSIFIRFDLVAAPNLQPGEVGQCRLELSDIANPNNNYFITAWLNSAQSQIQDATAIDVATGADGDIQSYFGSGYYFLNGRFLEYRILKSDFPQALDNMCMSPVSIVDGASDYVLPVYLKK